MSIVSIVTNCDYVVIIDFQVKILCSDINNYQQAVQQDNLRPLPGQNPQGYETQVGATSKTVGSLMAQLLSAADRVNNNIKYHAYLFMRTYFTV